MKSAWLTLLTSALCLADSVANVSQARAALNRGELVNAEQILTTSLDDARARLGSTSTALDPALELLAQVYQREKRYPEAASIEQQRVDNWTAAAGENAVVVGRVLQQKSTAERQAGNLPAAEADSRRALAIMTAAYVDQPASAQAAADLGDVLVAENRDDEAEQMLALAEKTFETSLGPSSILTIGMTVRRAAILKKLGKPVTAAIPSATAYRVGGSGQNQVVAPRIQSKVEPQYAEEARQHKLQGSIQLSVVIDGTGTPTQIVVLRPLGMGLDQKAVEAVSQWKFTPGQKNGVAVPVFSTIEMSFHLL